MMVTMRLATTFLPPAEIARVFLISSAVAFYASILLNPVGMFMNRRFHSWDDRGAVRFFYNYFWLYLLLVALFSSLTISVLVVTNLLDFHTDLYWVLFLTFASILISTANQVFIPGLNLLGFGPWSVYLTLATTAASLVVASVMMIFVKDSAEYWMVGLLTGQLLIAYVGGRLFYRCIRYSDSHTTPVMKITNDHLGLIWKFSWPILISACLIWGQTQGYRFFMENSLGLSQVGLFVAGYGISAGIIAGFEAILTTYFQPIFYRHLSKEDVVEHGVAWTNYASAILPSSLLVTFFLVAAAPEITKLFLGASYSESAQFVIWGAVAELARVAAGVYGMVAHAKMKMQLLLFPNTIGVVTSILMISLLAPEYGTVGVGFSLAVSGILVFIATYFATRTELTTSLSFITLIKALIVGFLLMMLSMVIRQIVGIDGFLSALLFIFLLALLYLPAQYWLLSPYFSNRIKN